MPMPLTSDSSTDITLQLKRALAYRESLGLDTNAMRLVNSFGDGLEGLVLERYHQHVVAQIFDTRWLKEMDRLTSFVEEHLGAEYFVVKDRTESAVATPEGFKTYVLIDQAPSRTVVTEHGLKFTVDLNDALNCGLFLDMRANRKVIADLAQGRKVLNCFSYTCSFGVHCRAGGASSVVNVDISKKSLERGRVNYELNQLIPAKDEFIRGDALRYLERAVKIGNRFDLMILDPPSFARYEGMKFSVKKDLAHLIEMAMKVLNPGGVIFIASNLSDMTHDIISNMITEAAGDREVREVKRLGQDADFVGSGSMLESYLAAVLSVLA